MNKNMRFFRPIKFGLGFLVIVAGFSAVVMLLWNCLMPSIFGLGVISFWQSLGLLVLARLLFGGFGKFGRAHRFGHHHHHHNPLFDKWAEMSDEERKEFIQNKRQRWAQMDDAQMEEFINRRRGHFAHDCRKKNDADK